MLKLQFAETQLLGIGRMMANALHANGAAKVYILGRRLEKLEETAKISVCIGPCFTREARL
jgi:glutamyl-tRNA reductase